jgi:Asp-tRNA(Asn)/Glu-tRNA(Gln) amidotransferase A subunit family amidase
VLPLAPSFDTVGWLTRDPAVLLRAGEATLADAARVEPAQRLALAPALLADLDEAVRDAFLAALHGTAVDEVDLGDVDRAYEAFRTVQAFEAWRTHGPWIEAHPGALRGGVADRFQWASTIGEAEAAAAGLDLEARREALRALLDERTLVLPAAGSPAPRSDTGDATVERARAQTLRLTCFASLAGVPAISAPLAAVDGAPLGVSLVGRPHGDLGLIRLAAGLRRG